MHPFFRVLFYGSPLWTPIALVALVYTEARFAPDWGKIRNALLKATVTAWYVPTICSWAIVGTMWISQWLPSELLVWPLGILVVLAFLGALQIGEKVARYGTKQRRQFLNDIAKSAACRN